jgi:hypothetical protein
MTSPVVSSMAIEACRKRGDAALMASGPPLAAVATDGDKSATMRTAET